MSKIIGIYKITSPTGRIYIGQSVNVLRRWVYHKKMYDADKGNILYKSLQKHTPQKHTFTLLEQCERKKLNERERFYVEKYDTFETEHGMNLTKGGDSNVVFSKATLKKMSLAKKGKPSTRKNFKHTDETKEVLRQLAIGNTNMLGKKHTKETIELLREASKGNTHWRGKTHTLESRQKMSESCMGRIISIESRKKLARTNTGVKNNVPRTSKYYGISYNKNRRRWRAVIKINKKQKYIGMARTEQEAAKLYDAYVLKHIPYEIPLNFPESANRYKQLALF